MILEVKNLSFSYENQKVLENINFIYKSSDFLSIIGPNGGGKSTLLKLILNILTPKSGEILLDGVSAKKLKNKFGYVPQDTNINMDFPINVYDAVLMGRVGQKAFGFYTKEDKQKAHECIELVGMSEFKKRKIGELSGGQRQRVFIARALVCDADILVLDEPTASIDMDGQVKIYDLLKELNKQKGIIVVSHDVNVSIAYATKIAYVSKTLFMHESSSIAKESFYQTLQTKNNHLCPVELLTTNICNHKNMKWQTK